MCFKAKNVDVEKPGVIFCVSAVLEGLAMVTYGVVLVTQEGTSGEVVEASYLVGMAVFLTTAFVYFALDAVFAENKFQLAAAVLISILTTGFVLVKYLNKERSGLGQFWRDSRLYFLVAKAVFSLVSVILTPLVLDSFGYRTFRVVGTDPAMIHRYSRFLQLWTMLRLDLVVNLVMISSCESVNAVLHCAHRTINHPSEPIIAGSGILSSEQLTPVCFHSTDGFLYKDMDRLKNAQLTTALSAAAAAVGVLQVVVGWAAATRESSCLFAFFLIFAASQPAYVIYRLFFCFLDEDCEARPQQVSNAFFIAAAAATILVKLVLLVASALVAFNFHQGLKQTVFDRHKH